MLLQSLYGVPGTRLRAYIVARAGNVAHGPPFFAAVAVEVPAAGHVAPALPAVLGPHVRGALLFAVGQAVL